MHLLVVTEKYSLRVRTLLEDLKPEACARWMLLKCIVTDLSLPAYLVCIFKYFNDWSSVG
jgi:hypothetical protein